MDIVEEIKRIKKRRKAVILVHNYQLPQVQDIADFLGDSLGLSIKASQTEAEVIVFCGVYFMAETAKILSPQKTVLIPDREAGCPMADMITAQDLIELKREHPKAKVLCYVNTSAEVKAEVDFCCTSANALKMVREALKDEKEIIFIPDKYLTHYVSVQTGREFIAWQGYCPTHIKILAEDIKREKSLHPQAQILVHPECKPEVIRLADRVLSTQGMVKFAREAQAREMIIATEKGIIHRLKKENPQKEFYPASDLAICPNMKRITLEKVLWSLKENTFEVKIPQNIILRAKESIQRMLDFKD